MRKPIIAGNWKMNKDVNEAVQLVNEIKRGVSDIDNVDIIVCPPYVDLSDAGEMLASGNIGVGGQNCFWEKEGAYTGEISVGMLKSVGCGYVIIGHSERRKYFGETNETVNKRIKAAIEGGLVPIICVGETLEEREAGKTMDVVKDHVEGALSGFDEGFIKDIVIAYEPVWAIGTGKTATPDQAQEVHAMIRKLLEDLYSGEWAAGTRILYGGSVKPSNIEELMKQEDIDGGLIGGASLKSEGFVDIIKTTSGLYA
ncbi:MAG: triose-phosphate isomerase [Candidatus Omnitrophica bacterium]|nr:triose-phosphate isomerase [Candidatus Omnitrophota bacterium]